MAAKMALSSSRAPAVPSGALPRPEEPPATPPQQPQHYQGASPRPTHFVAVRLVSEEIRRKVRRLQRWFVARDTRFERCLVSVERLHTPLLLTCLSSTHEVVEEEARARAACAEAGRLVREFLSGETVQLLVSGTGHFGSRVMFARVRTEPAELLESMHHLIARAFLRHGFPVLDEASQTWLERGDEFSSSGFTGHASFLKVTKAIATSRTGEEKRMFRSLLLDEAHCNAVADMVFGSQLCVEFELLSMLGLADDGYYPRLRRERLHLTVAQLRPPPALLATGASQVAGAALPAEALAAADRAFAAMPTLGDVELPVKRLRCAPGHCVDGTPDVRGAEASEYRFALVALGADVWPAVLRGLVCLRDLFHFAAVAREGLAVLHRVVVSVRVALLSVPDVERRPAIWKGRCRRFTLLRPSALLQQPASHVVCADFTFAASDQADLLGRGPEVLRGALCAASGVVRVLLAPGVHLEVDAIQELVTPTPRVLKTLHGVQPRVLAVAGLSRTEFSRWAALVGGLTRLEVLIHSWTEDDVFDAGCFAEVLKVLPPSVRGLDFQNVVCPLSKIPVALLPAACVAFGTVVLQGDVDFGSTSFESFILEFPTFPPSVKIVRAVLGTEAQWTHSAQLVADVFCAKFPGLGVLQLELSLGPGVDSSDAPFVGLARTLIGMGVRVEVTGIRGRQAQYEFLRAAMEHAGAVVARRREPFGNTARGSIDGGVHGSGEDEDEEDDDDEECFEENGRGCGSGEGCLSNALRSGAHASGSSGYALRGGGGGMPRRASASDAVRHAYARPFSHAKYAWLPGV